MSFHLLGLTAGSRNGNSEICLREALDGAAESGVTSSIIRVDELDLPIGPNFKEQGDVPWYWEQLMECDGIIISAPIYSRILPFSLKVLADKALGPNADAAIVERLLAMKARGEDPAVWFRVDERVLRPRVAGFIAVGGALTTQWKSLALPTFHTLTLSMQIAVVDQFVISGAGTSKSILLDPESLARSRALGVNVASQAGKAFDDASYLGPQGACPMCHLDIVELRGAHVECGTCGARGSFRADHSVDWNDFSGCVLTMAERREHYEEILSTAEMQNAQKSIIEERSAPYNGDALVITPPR